VNISCPHRAFFLVAAASALAYVSLPRDTAYYDRWYQLFPIAAVVATLVGVTVNRPRARAPWYLVALSGLLTVAADAVYATQLELGESVPFPSTADYLALAGYVVLAAALLLMIRRQAPGRDWPSLIDAGIVTAGFAIVAWTFLVQPRLVGDSTALETAVALAFPVMDVLLVSLAARMVLGPGMRTTAFVLVSVALVFQLVGDALYGFGSLHGWYRVGDPVDMLFVMSAVLWGTAALHPSMVDLTEPNPDPEQRLGRRRLAVLSFATLMAPAMLAVAAFRSGSSELLVIVGAAATLSVLVVVRLAGLVARHERAERRERVIGSAAAALVAAWTREDVYEVAVDAALEIAQSEAATVGLALGDVEDFRIIAASGVNAERLRSLGSDELSPEALAAIEEARVPDGPRTVRFPGESGEWTVVRLAVAEGIRGAFVFQTQERLPKRAREGVETLAAQVALALESATLAEDLHERQSAARFRSLVQNSSDVILLLSPDLTIRYHTPSVERVLGYTDDELTGASLESLLLGEEPDGLEDFFAEVRATAGSTLPRDLPLRRKDGTSIRLESVFNNMLDDPNVRGVVVTARDVTERRELEEQLAHQAYHDSLTGLANRLLFTDRIAHALERGHRHRNLFAVLFIDLDDFKTVNDSLGHAAGDELLVEVARRIRSCVRPEDTCARLGGDEFAVMIEDLESPGTATTVADRILSEMARPLIVLGSEVTVQGSVGIALGTGEQTASEIMRSADLAMYRAKNEGKARYALFEPAMHTDAIERLALKADLQRADIAEEFELHYQPIVTVHEGALVGVEALLRWRQRDRGLVLPGEFIELAEETGLVLPLGRHVLREACRQVASWRANGYAALGVSVNISAKQLASRSLRADVAAALEQAGLDSSALTLEITESTLLDSQLVIRRLEELRSLGVRIAIDDFGTGYSSLNYLHRFPVDTLKIAHAFVEELGANADQERLVAAILRLGATLGLDAIAEGVETIGQRDRLRTLGCKYAQGFLFSHPLPADELGALLFPARVA
jgi:diguanylate cyclase (GGDEF)-like protein/PAS domain S-box-containing protein